MKNISLKNLIIIFCIMGLVLSLPSIIYLVQNKTIDNYSGQNYYFINMDDTISSIVGAIIFALIIIISFIIYFKIIKKSYEFKNIKFIILSVFLVSLIFMICLPNTSEDVFYYMGIGRVFEEYNQNPYYTTIGDILNTGIKDNILEYVSSMYNTLSPYGPIWIMIQGLFSFISGNNFILYLYTFKFASLLVHLATCYIIYKITGKKKFTIMYGFNPFLIMEFLVNVHNDIYLVFFVMLGIYFLKNKKNIWIALICFTCSIAIKYITIIIVPFFILYYIKDKTNLKKVLYGLIYTMFVMILLATLYFKFFNSVSDFLTVFNMQQGKIKSSIYLILYLANLSNSSLSLVYSFFVYVFIYYFIVYILLAFLKEKNFVSYMQYIYNLLLLLIFGVLTNLTSWYLSWLFIPIFWLKPKNIKFILYLQFIYELTYTYLCFIHTDAAIYEAAILPIIIVSIIIRQIIIKIRRRNISCKKMKSIL